MKVKPRLNLKANPRLKLQFKLRGETYAKPNLNFKVKFKN